MKTRKSLDSLEVYLKNYINNTVLLAPHDGSMQVRTISLAGHSLGASIATIAALGIAEQILKNNFPAKIDVRLISYASPKVGNKQLWMRLDELNVDYDHYFIDGDLITEAPPFFYQQHPNRSTQHKLKAANKELRENIRVSV